MKPKRRLPILAGALVLSIALIAMTMGGDKPASDAGSGNSISENSVKLIIADQKYSERYKRQQQAVKTAVKVYFEKAIAAGEIVGAGVSIVRGDSIVVADGFGKRNININKAVDGQTIFRLGSLSKGFTGILAARLKTEGILDWKDKVSDCFPEFQLGDKNNTGNITLANILSHTAGAPYHSYTNLVEAGLPLTEIAHRFKKITPISKPGLLYSYQNALFALSGEMMYKVTGQDIATSLENRFFKPLGMCSAIMDHETLMLEENVALPHSKRRNQWRPKKLDNTYYNAIAAGGINANALDMARWMRFLLGHNPEVMNRSALAEAFNPFIEIKGHGKYYQRWPGHVSSHYGYGWRIHKFTEGNALRENTIWHHGGSVNDFRNEIAIYPEADLGICVLLNSNSPLAKTVIPDLYNLVKEVYAESGPNIAQNSIPGTRSQP